MEMDAVKTTENETVKDIPPVPIKTYKWEDIRREKRKGRYPYTHLTKKPYNEEIDPSEFKMDTLKTSKSSSVLEKSSSGVDIQDVTDKSNSKDYLNVSAANEGIVETADSSNEDNISQYLDKDDDPPVITEDVETPGTSKEEDKMEVDDKPEERAKSEEPKRKRKLSIESSYSRISLSKLGVMKKLREAKEKLKLPKLSFSKSESKLDIPKKSKKENKSSRKQSAQKALEAYLEQKKDETPVYIHIPLKPPPGETDEFSYLEFEDPKSDAPSKPTSTTSDKSDLEKINEKEPHEEKEKEGVQFIILTAPSDDETLDNHVILPDTPSANNGKKFFENAKFKDLKSLAKECVDEISPDTPIDGIIFEDVIQVEYVDEHNRPIGTTERSNILEVTEENLPKIEKQLSQRNLVKELQKEIASSMDSLNKMSRQSTLKKLKEQYRSKSNESLKKVGSYKQKLTREAPELTIIIPKKSETSKETKEKSEELKIQMVAKEKKEVPKPTEEKPEIQEIKKEAMYDEEDGLKLSATAVQMINEELAKEKLPKTSEDQLKAAAGSIKKKVSFKRRSKQEDPHGIYEDVRVTSDSKNVDGKEQQTKELKVIEPSQSMSVDEEKTYLDDKIMKTTSLEEDYNKWSKLTDHEYEPINPPVESEQSQPSPPDIQVTDASEKNISSKQPKKSPPNSIRIPLKNEDVVQSEEEVESADVLTVEEMQARIEDQFFNSTFASSQQEATPTVETTPTSTSKIENVSQESQAKKIQDAFKAQAGKLRTKLRNIKKPNIQMPQRPSLEKFKIHKPNINMPKIPDSMRVNLPSFTLPKKDSSAKKRTVKQYSTESNAGGSKKKIFDFRTYPRMFRKKKKTDDFEDDDVDVSATVPRVKSSPKSRSSNAKATKQTKQKSPDVIRIPLHSEESMDKEENELPSRDRYEDENIGMDDAYFAESQQMNTASAFSGSDFSRNRWNHGSFHGHNLNEIANNETEMNVTDLDNEIERAQTSPEPEIEPESEPTQGEMRSVSSFGDVHRPSGVLEKINSNEYVILPGNYAIPEFREALREPINPLMKIQANDSFDREFDISDQSFQEVPKRRPIKKPKRKKTPNVSKEFIPSDQESEPEEYPKPFNEQPARPKRKNKQKKKVKDDKPPYQESMFDRDPEFEIMRKSASDNILLSDKMDNNFHNDHFRPEYSQHYENERMEGIEQPNILISDPYQREEFRYTENENQNLNKYDKDIPEAPPRKQRSLKSLVSEHDSIVDEINLSNQNFPQTNVEAYKLEHEYIIPTADEPPIRPIRTRSRTRSQSRATSQPEEEMPETLEPEVPCVEEPCIQQICDSMGYAVIEKNRHREPPLPPVTKRKKSATPAKSETKFFTVPRPLKEEAPIRPVRNYSTLVPKSKKTSSNLEEEKENVDLGQYIEINDDDGHSRLQSGDVVQKMKDRPLPAPPRPPRKSKESDKDAPFKDITHKNNLELDEPIKEKLEETEASVQTEPLPDDFVCEELVQEKGDKIITPTTSKLHPPITEFENIETVTHGALIVTPVAEDFEEGPLTQFSRSTEKIITIRKEFDHKEETTDIPESFKTLEEPQSKITKGVTGQSFQHNPEVEILKAQKLQVSDLDVDRLMVNELLASKIKVSEIDGESISVTEINPKSGNLVIGGLELPINFIQDIMEKLTKPHGSTENQLSTPQQNAQDSEYNMADTKTEVSAKEEDLTLPSKGKDKVSLVENENPDPQREQPELKEITLFSKDDKISPNVQEQLTLASKEENRKIPFKTKGTEENLSETNEKISSPPDAEPSPTVLQATLELLDENISLNLKETADKTVEEILQSAIDSKNKLSAIETPILTTDDITAAKEQYPVEEKSESTDLEEIPPLIPDTSEEERLIEQLKSTSPGQKKNSD